MLHLILYYTVHFCFYCSKVWGCVIYLFLNQSNAHQKYIYLIKTSSNVAVKYDSRILFEYILKCNLLLNFQHNFSSLRCHVILQKSFKYGDLLLKKIHLIML